MKNLRDLRIDHDLTQQQMADYLGVSRPTYSNYETDVHDPSPDVLRKLADYFHVSTDYLLEYIPKAGTDKAVATRHPYTANFLSRRESLLLEDFRCLNESGKYRVENCVRTEKELQAREEGNNSLKKMRQKKAPAM